MLKKLRQWQEKRLARQRRILALLAHHPEDDVQVGQYYVRTGNCTQCGKCCESIHLMHKGGYIRTPWQFAWLKFRIKDFRSFEPIGHSEDGIVFKCNYLKEDKTCGAYASRPAFCQKYPNEQVKLLGSCLPEECGYDFKAINGFATYIQ